MNHSLHGLQQLIYFTFQIMNPTRLVHRLGFFYFHQSRVFLRTDQFITAYHSPYLFSLRFVHTHPLTSDPTNTAVTHISTCTGANVQEFYEAFRRGAAAAWRARVVFQSGVSPTDVGSPRPCQCSMLQACLVFPKLLNLKYYLWVKRLNFTD